MAQFILGQGPVDPGKLYGALINAGLTVDPRISASILCTTGGWSEVYQATVRSAHELSFVAHVETRMFLLTWSDGEIATATAGLGDYLVATAGEVGPIAAQNFLEEIPNDQRAALKNQSDLLASWYAGRVQTNSVFGDFSRVSAQEIAQLEADRNTQVMPKVRPMDRLFREDLVPCFAGSCFAGAFISKRERAGRVIVSGGHSIARGSLGASTFITSSPKLVRALVPGCLARTPQEPELFILRALS